MAKTKKTPREYTMPNNYEQGGYATYNQSADRMVNAELIGNDIASLKAQREKVQQELDDLKIKRQNFDLLSVNVPEQTDEDKENIRAGQFRAGAEAMMEYDPATAQSWLLRADEIEARKQKRIEDKSPDAIRFKLMSAANTLNARISAIKDPNDPQLPYLTNLAFNINEEVKADEPSIQRAYMLLNQFDKIHNGGAGGGTTDGITIKDGKPYKNNVLSTNASDWYSYTTEKGKQKPIANAGVNMQNAPTEISSKFVDDMKRWEKETYVKPATDVDMEVDKLFGGSSTEPVPAAYQRYDKSLNAYNAAKSAFNEGAFGPAIGNFLYSLRPEAVNEGDITLAANGSATITEKGLRALAAKFGVNVVDQEKIATKLASSAYNKLIDDRKANTDQIVALLNKLSGDAVRKRALIYYKLPVKIGGAGSGSKTNQPTTGGESSGGKGKAALLKALGG